MTVFNWEKKNSYLQHSHLLELVTYEKCMVAVRELRLKK